MIHIIMFVVFGVVLLFRCGDASARDSHEATERLMCFVLSQLELKRGL